MTNKAINTSFVSLGIKLIQIKTIITNRAKVRDGKKVIKYVYELEKIEIEMQNEVITLQKFQYFLLSIVYSI